MIASESRPRTGRVCRSLRAAKADLAAIALVAMSAVGCGGRLLESSGETGTGGAGGSAGSSGAQSSTGGIAGATGGGLTGGKGGIANGGTGGVVTGGAGAAGAVSTGGTDSCDALSNEASTAFQTARDTADTSCATDSDCVPGPVLPCVPGCAAPVVSEKGAAQLQAAVDAEANLCTAFAKLNCRVEAFPCIAAPGGPACVNGKCEYFISTAWQAFGMVESGESSQTDCLGNVDCTSWKINPDGTIEKASGNTAGGGPMQPGDFQTVKAIIESVSFRQGFVTGFQCPPAMVARFVTFTRYNSDGSTDSADVSGCIYAGPNGSDELTLYTIVQKY